MSTKDRMREDMEIRNYSPKTIEAYLHCCHRFVAHHMQPPENLTRDDVRAFLLHLINERGFSNSAVGQYRAAIKFMYEITLGSPRQVERILVPKKEKRLPTVLSREEVNRLLSNIECFKHRTIFTKR